MGLDRVRGRRASRPDLPLPGESAAAWADALVDCRDAGELAAFVHHVGYSELGALAGLHQFLLDAAERARHIPAAAHVANALDLQADTLDQLGGQLDNIVIDLVDQTLNAPPTDPDHTHTQVVSPVPPGLDHPGPRTPPVGARPATPTPPPQRRGPR